MQYAATPVVVIGPGTKRWSGAFVTHGACATPSCIGTTGGRAHGPTRMALDPRHHRYGCMPVCHSGGCIRRVWPGGPRAVGVLANWATWWVMAGADYRAWLC